MKLAVLWFSAGILMADVRYTLRCEIESSDKVVSKSGALRQAMKDCTSEILQTADRQLSRNSKTTQILEFASESTITIDHEKKTWTRNGTAVAEQAAQASMDQLKQMGAVFQLISNPLTEPKEIAGYSAKGLASVLTMSFNFPGMDKGMSSRAQMEFWISESAPGAKEIMEWAKKQKKGPTDVPTSPTMRMMAQFLATMPGGRQMLKDGENLVGQLLEMSMTMETKGLADTLTMKMVMRAEKFDTSPIAASEFAIPDGYQEVK